MTTADEPTKVIAHLAEHWDEDMGDVLWWNFPVEEAPYCGTPLDDDFPKYKTHFTELHIPDEVEEEQLYQVIINGDYLIKLFDNRNDHKFVGKEDLVIWLPSGYQLTEAEIKAIDERYWPFAVPTEQVEV
ncbi:DUF1642 domain-containing protein [Enterococcus avium]|uniref:DUF1642 domain-containing protein n=1 Tax=Enterococcus avium TaxID=33945 RepID=UPI0032E40E0C